MTWTWRMEDGDGAVMSIAAPAQLSQSDAESWLGEHWRELSEQGVAAVTLLEDDRIDYGPMSLSTS
jgi:hypothetical protein